MTSPRTSASAGAAAGRVLAIKGDDAVLAKVHELGDKLKAAGLRVQVDDRNGTSFGRAGETHGDASEVSTIGQAVEAAGTGGTARVPWATLREEGEVGPVERAVTVRRLVAEDGAVPGAGEAPGNVAVVARAS